MAYRYVFIYVCGNPGSFLVGGTRSLPADPVAVVWRKFTFFPCLPDEQLASISLYFKVIVIDSRQVPVLCMTSLYFLCFTMQTDVWLWAEPNGSPCHKHSLHKALRRVYSSIRSSCRGWLFFVDMSRNCGTPKWLASPQNLSLFQ